MKLLFARNPLDCRIEKLEFLDEGGLLIQLLRHYCISVGYNDKNNIGQLTL